MPRPLEFRETCSSGRLILLSGSVAIVAGVAAESAAAVGMGMVLALIPWIVRRILRSAAEGTIIEQSGPEAVYEGDDVEIMIRITNGSRWPLFFPRFMEIFGPEDDAQKTIVFPDRMLPGEVVELPYHGSCRRPRGLHEYGPSALVLSDPFGWFEERRHVRATWTLKVYPRITRLHLPEQMGRSLHAYDTGVVQNRVGSGSEFFAVRDYRPSDSRRSIHGPLSARFGRPIVKEFAPDMRGDLTVVLDVSRQAVMGLDGTARFEESIRFVASLASRAFERRHRIQLLTGTERGHSLLFGAELTPLVQVLEFLVPLTAGTRPPSTSVLRHFQANLAVGATVVLTVHPGAPGLRELAGMIPSLTRRGVRVICAAFDVGTRLRLMPPDLRRLSNAGAELFLVRVPHVIEHAA